MLTINKKMNEIATCNERKMERNQEMKEMDE